MKLRLLFNGFRHGHIYGLYKKAMENDKVEIVGAIEADEGARAAAEKAVAVTFSDRSYDEWLSDNIDAVAVGNAYGQRGKIIIAALKAGKHVIADKPICTDPHELAEIRRLSMEKGLVVTCMLDLRYLPQTLTAKRILGGGELGEIRNLSFFGQHYLDYGHRPDWYYEEGMHGGTINDIAIHGVDLVRFLTGSEIESVDGARVWNSFATEQRGFKDSAVFMARLQSGASLIADVSYSAPSQVFAMPTYWEFRFWCERGMLTFCYADSHVTVYRDGRSEAEVYDGDSTDDDWLRDFIRQIEKGDLAPTENTLRSSASALMIQKKAYEGKDTSNGNQKNT